MRKTLKIINYKKHTIRVVEDNNSTTGKDFIIYSPCDVRFDDFCETLEEAKNEIDWRCAYREMQKRKFYGNNKKV